MNTVDFNQILENGKIVDNKRVKSLNMKEVLKIIAQDSVSFKCAVGYFYLEGLVEIINSLKGLQEIKILMGYETTKQFANSSLNLDFSIASAIASATFNFSKSSVPLSHNSSNHSSTTFRSLGSVMIAFNSVFPTNPLGVKLDEPIIPALYLSSKLVVSIFLKNK